MRPESSLYMKLLQLCIDKKSQKHGLLIHGKLITNGFQFNVNLSTKLIIFYSKLSSMVTARYLFDNMSERSIISWTAIISGYSQTGEAQNALLVFWDMHRSGVKGNQFTYGSVLKACTSIRCLELGMQIQGCIQKSRFVQNLFVQSALVDMHSKCGRIRDASYFFEIMPKRDLVSWNAMIGGYAFQGFADKSFEVFRLMLRQGLVPDCFTFGNLLKASTWDSGLLKVCQIHCFIIQMGFESDIALTGSMIDAYAKTGSIACSCYLYNNMPIKDIMCLTSLINGYAREGIYSRDDLNIVCEIAQMHMKIDNVLLSSLLSLCANIASLILGRQIHALAIKYQPCYEVAVGNALIDMYAKSGQIEDANHAFNELTEKNVISWTTLIAGYGKHGFGNKSIALFKKMEGSGLKPNDITFLSLLFACSHTGLTNEGWEFFSTMITKYNILPRSEHFSCLVDLIARGGQLEEAFDLIQKINVKPNASVWGAVLGACNFYGNISIGEAAAMNLFNIDPDNSTNYIVLASMYASSGMWENAWKARKFFKEKGLRKEPGYSFMGTAENDVEIMQLG